MQDYDAQEQIPKFANSKWSLKGIMQLFMKIQLFSAKTWTNHNRCWKLSTSKVFKTNPFFLLSHLTLFQSPFKPPKGLLKVQMETDDTVPVPQ